MKRRTLLAAGAAALAAPAIGRGETARVLTFVPQADLAVLDPIWTTAYVTRNHGFMVFDTLYGQDRTYAVSPQMAEGAVVEGDGKTWRIALRQGLTFHDGEPVRAVDCVASLRRWGARDAFGQALMAVTDELSAADDRTIVFRLKKPFPSLPEALGKTGSNIPVIMPERLARTDPFTQVTEMVGSGPYRFKADERVPGARIVYERFAGYLPRANGRADFTAGPKVAHFDRVEWHVIPDAATAAAALGRGEVDWWEAPTADLLPLLRGNRDIKVEVPDPTGYLGVMRPNFLHPPFDNVAVRRAVLPALNEADFMAAAAGTDPSLSRSDVGVFCPVSPMANAAGLDALTGPRSLERAQAMLKASGYGGEPVVFLGATDLPTIDALANVGADLLKRIGFTVDYQATDWGTLVQRRVRKDAPEKGGWSVFCTYWSGLDVFTPAADPSIRGNGAGGWFGWPDFPQLETLRNAWLDAEDVAEQKRIAAEIQRTILDLAAWYPLGLLYQPTAYRQTLSGVLTGFPLFWNVRRS